VDAHRRERAKHARGYRTAVCDQYFVEHPSSPRQSLASRASAAPPLLVVKLMHEDTRLLTIQQSAFILPS
jgi:hypothetical protein